MITAKEASKRTVINKKSSLKGFDYNDLDKIMDALEDGISSSVENKFTMKISSKRRNDLPLMSEVQKRLKKGGYKHQFVRSGSNKSGCKLSVYWD